MRSQLAPAARAMWRARIWAPASSVTFASRRGGASGVAGHRLDVRAPACVARVIADVAPSVVVNASNSGADWAVNADGEVRYAWCWPLSVRDAVWCMSPATRCSPVQASATTRTACPIRSPVRRREGRRRDSGAACDAGRRRRPHLAHLRARPIQHECTVHALADGTRDGALFTYGIRCTVNVEDLAAASWEIALSDEAGVLHLAGRAP